MTPQQPTARNTGGFTLLEILLALAVVAVFAVMSMNYSMSVSRGTALNRAISSRDRILSGIRYFAGMPAALRNSTRASTPASLPYNPSFYNCVSGGGGSNCLANTRSPFTLFLPISPPSGLAAISSPEGSPPTVHYDFFGQPCVAASSDCAIEVFTSFVAQCPPPAVASAPVGVTPAQLQPLASCTVADLMIIYYTVQLDPAIAQPNPAFSSFISPVSGSVVVSVRAISGNSPQP